MMRKLFFTLSILLVGCSDKETDATTVELDKSAVLQASLDIAFTEVQILKNTNAALNKENGALRVEYNNATNTISVLSEEIDLIKAVIEQQKNFIMQLRQQPPAQPKPAVAGVILRSEFEASVRGKTKNQVLAFKKPFRKYGAIALSDGIYERWHYKDITFDPITGKKDDGVHIQFRNGQVNKFTYVP